MYLSYAEYADMGGTCDATAFQRYAFKACKAIDAITAKRVSAMAVIPEAVKKCVFELVELESIYAKNIASITAEENMSGGVMSSFSTDGYSETYATGGSGSGEYIHTMRVSLDETQKALIRDYLAYEYDDNNTPLLYRGVY